MTPIPFEHEGCDEWGVYESQYIAAEDAKNIHIAEGRSRIDEEGTPVFKVNQQHRTICGERILQKNGKICVFQDAMKLRSRLAELQNQGNEVCGTCVSHFYADPEP